MVEINQHNLLVKLQSKKNDVYLECGREMNRIHKSFTDERRFRREKEIIELLDGSCLQIPKHYDINDSRLEILYEYIEGCPVVELVDQLEYRKLEALIEKICVWLKDFYTTIFERSDSHYILGDIHLRNFLYETETERIFGIDFEECHPGKIETDIARLYVFILFYDPAFSLRKERLAAYFRKRMTELYQLNEDYFNSEVEREITELIVRRRISKKK